MYLSKTLSILAFVSVFLAAGCVSGGAAPEPIIITATPATPLPTEAPTLPPTPTALPTPVPDEALRLAQRYLNDGRYDLAIATFQAVLVQPVEWVAPDVRAAATYGLGEAALREGAFAESLTGLTNFLTEFPADGRAGWAYFLRGDALMGLGQWQAAMADFQQYLALRPGIIDSYVYERLGDATLALEQSVEALQYYEQAIAAGRSLVPLLALRERVAQVYLNTGQPQAAVGQYDAILDVARNAGYRAEIMFLAAQALETAGDLSGAYARYARLMEAYPNNGYAYQSLQILQTAGQPVEAELWGRVAFAADDFEGAVNAFHRYTSQLPLAEIPVEIHLMLGRAYRASGNSAAAWTSFQTIIDQFPTSEFFGEALLEQGRTRFLAGDIPGAIERYSFLADTYPQLTEAPTALWRVAYLLETQGQSAESLAGFERLGREYPGNDMAMDGLLRAATAALNRADVATAERVLAALGATGTGQEVAAAYLWLGKLAQTNGNSAQAESALRAAAAADPGGYFSIRAQDQLLGRSMFGPPVSVTFSFDDQLELGQAEDWLRATFGITQAEALWPMSAELQADPRYVAGRELWALLAVYEAGREFSGLLDAYEDNPLASYQLAIWFRGIGAYSYSVAGAANIIRAAGAQTLDAPPYLARMRYPAFYAELVQAEAQNRGFDPLVLLALIRQESLFNRYATAAAGEKGLTQVIPPTGDHIASRLNWPDYQHADLFKPYASIAFGGYYLWEQLNLFDGSVPVALAAYNAGPGNAMSWQAQSGPDPDLFVEAIGISSTKGYVRRIYEQYDVYRALYGSG